MIAFKHEGIEYRFFDHIYAVSSCGKILRKLVPYKPEPRPDGYVDLGHSRLLHRVVAALWLPQPEGATHVHHKNRDKSDNRIQNLEWLTPKAHLKEHDHRGDRGRYVRSIKTRKKMSDWKRGLTDSEETRLKKVAILNKVRPSTACSFKGRRFKSVAAGGRALKIHATVFRARCLSKNFPEYKLLI